MNVHTKAVMSTRVHTFPAEIPSHPRISLSGYNSGWIRVSGAVTDTQGRLRKDPSGYLGAGGRRFKSSRPDLTAVANWPGFQPGFFVARIGRKDSFPLVVSAVPVESPFTILGAAVGERPYVLYSDPTVEHGRSSPRAPELLPNKHGFNGGCSTRLDGRWPQNPRHP